MSYSWQSSLYSSRPCAGAAGKPVAGVPPVNSLFGVAPVLSGPFLPLQSFFDRDQAHPKIEYTRSTTSPFLNA